MSKFLPEVGQIMRYFRSLIVLCLLCLVLTWSLPAQAATRVNPQLEEQVLEIIRKYPEVIIESVQVYQQQKEQKLNKVRQVFLEDLKTNPQAVIADSPTIGSNESKTILVEFSDFQCPYCSEAHQTLKKLIAKHQKDVNFVYKHYPLTPIHAQAMPAAKAAWAAQQQGKFWEYQDALFTNQDKLGESLYVNIAKKLNLDLAIFNQDREIANTAIEQDIQLAKKLGLSGTPSFIISSEKVSGAVQISDLENILANAK
ncbi:MAG: DsbA family protein [Pelatocladus maniniholoensis HA4357-MV3]|jgi:protein-disulfide isomerase|uniref:DsbA family protein n=1 Tax=Pelatocladus maniniholoensis HA4357-MV3 TaxID=1117104 RepID=A0A9E3H9R4_9NOST|nr:DsbA family protein [Pelatocladus maniniholoensis HA4357-MV3]BAZ68170.1 DSBA oxidoreductase [Fischerella sp. NIES-4106]